MIWVISYDCKLTILKEPSSSIWNTIVDSRISRNRKLSQTTIFVSSNQNCLRYHKIVFCLRWYDCNLDHIDLEILWTKPYRTCITFFQWVFSIFGTQSTKWRPQNSPELGITVQTTTTTAIIPFLISEIKIGEMMLCQYLTMVLDLD